MGYHIFPSGDHRPWIGGRGLGSIGPGWVFRSPLVRWELEGGGWECRECGADRTPGGPSKSIEKCVCTQRPVSLIW